MGRAAQVFWSQYSWWCHQAAALFGAEPGGDLPPWKPPRPRLRAQRATLAVFATLVVLVSAVQSRDVLHDLWPMAGLADPFGTPEYPSNSAYEQGVFATLSDQGPAQAVRVLAASVLGDVGFDVLTARDGREALQVFSERAGQIRFVLLDLTMPRLAGQETLQAMRNIEPGARIILTSGFTAGDAEPDEGSHHADAFLEKPYTPTRLLQTVQRTLQR